MDLGPAGVIGVAIDSGWVSAVQLGRSGRAVRFRRLAPGSGMLTDAEAGRIMEVLARHGFPGRRVALAAPEDRLVTTTLQLPPGLGDEALASVVRMEMARAANARPDAVETGHLAVAPPPRSRQRQTVHASALRHEDAAQFMEPLLKAGADVAAIEPAGVAALRAARAVAGADPNGVVSILDIGWDRAQVIVARGGAFAYLRTDPELALSAMVERASRMAGLPAAVAERAVTCGLEGARPAVRRQLLELAQRLGQLAEAAQSYVLQEYLGSRDGGLLVHGPGARIAGLAEAAASHADLACTRLTPAMVCQIARSRYADDPALLTAAGLAMEEEAS